MGVACLTQALSTESLALKALASFFSWGEPYILHRHDISHAFLRQTAERHSLFCAEAVWFSAPTATYHFTRSIIMGMI